MADHFYSWSSAGKTLERRRNDITVATSAQAGNPIEIRITDGALHEKQVHAALEFLADLVARNDGAVVVPGTILI